MKDSLLNRLNLFSEKSIVKKLDSNNTRIIENRSGKLIDLFSVYSDFEDYCFTPFDGMAYLFIDNNGIEQAWANLKFSENNVFILCIESFIKGGGSKTVKFLMNNDFTVRGEALLGVEGFWDKFNPVWDGQNFTIYADK